MTEFENLLADKYESDTNPLTKGDWFTDSQRKKIAEQQQAQQAKATSEANATAAQPQDPTGGGTLIPGTDSTSPYHPLNFFSQSSMAGLNGEENKLRYQDWIKNQAPKFLTPEGISQYKKHAATKDNAFGLAEKPLDRAWIFPTGKQDGSVLGDLAVSGVSSLGDIAAVPTALVGAATSVLPESTKSFLRDKVGFDPMRATDIISNGVKDLVKPYQSATSKALGQTASDKAAISAKDMASLVGADPESTTGKAAMLAGSLGRSAYEYLTTPGLLPDAMGNLLGSAGGIGKVAGLATKVAAHAIEKEVAAGTLTRTAANEMTKKFADRSATGLAAGTQAASVTADVYHEAINTSDEKLAASPNYQAFVAAHPELTPDQAKKGFAENLASVAFASAAVLSLGSSKILGANSLEKRIAGGTAPAAGKSGVGAALKQGSKEATQEAVFEEGPGAAMQEYAKQYIDPTYKIDYTKIGSAAGQGAALGFMGGLHALVGHGGTADTTAPKTDSAPNTQADTVAPATDSSGNVTNNQLTILTPEITKQRTDSLAAIKAQTIDGAPTSAGFELIDSAMSQNLFTHAEIEAILDGKEINPNVLTSDTNPNDGSANTPPNSNNTGSSTTVSDVSAVPNSSIQSDAGGTAAVQSSTENVPAAPLQTSPAPNLNTETVVNQDGSVTTNQLDRPIAQTTTQPAAPVADLATPRAEPPSRAGISDLSRPERLVGQYVEYGGIDGQVQKADGNLYVVDNAGNKILIEGAKNGKTAKSIGINMLPQDRADIMHAAVNLATTAPISASELDARFNSAIDNLISVVGNDVGGRLLEPLDQPGQNFETLVKKIESTYNAELDRATSPDSQATPPASAGVAQENVAGAASTGDPSSQSQTVPKQVLIVSPLGSLKSQAGYQAAKTGDVVSALEVVRHILTPKVRAELNKAIGDSTVAPVINFAEKNTNRIPNALAAVLQNDLNKKVDVGVLRTTSDGRTSMAGIDRLFDSPKFNGDVKPGVKYYIVDDTITQGGTIAAMARYISKRGGIVTGAAALSGRLERSATLAITPETLVKVSRSVGKLEKDFYAASGKQYSDLTESEGRFILKDLGEFRTAVAERGRGQGARPDVGNSSSGEARPTASSRLDQAMSAMPAGSAPFVKAEIPKVPGTSGPTIRKTEPTSAQKLAAQVDFVDKEIRPWLNISGTEAVEKLKSAPGWTAFHRLVISAIQPHLEDVKATYTKPDGLAANAIGGYDPLTREIWLSPEATPEVVLHEMVHAAVDRILHLPAESLTSRQRSAIQLLEKLRLATEKGGEFPAAAQNVNEFVAYAMSNPEVMASLNAVETGSLLKTVMTGARMFVEAMAKILGIKINSQTSALDSAYAAFSQILSKPESRDGTPAAALSRTDLLNTREGEATMLAKIVAEPKGFFHGMRTSVAEKFMDYGAKGKDDILTEMETTKSDSLRAALKDFLQKFVLRDISGSTRALQQRVTDPVSDVIKQTAAAYSMDANLLRNAASEYATATHSLDQATRIETELNQSVEESKAMLDSLDSLAALKEEYTPKFNAHARQLDHFHDYFGQRGKMAENLFLRDRIFRKMYADFTAMSEAVNQLGIGPNPVSDTAKALINRALQKHAHGQRTAGDTRRMYEGARETLTNIRGMLDSKEAMQTIHDRNLQQQHDWIAAQQNDRVADKDGKMVTAIKLPGGLKQSEAQDIIDRLGGDADHGDAVKKVADAYVSGFKQLTEESVRLGIVTRQMADSFYADYPKYVNTQGMGIDDISRNLSEANHRSYINGAEGSRHQMQSNDIYTNLELRMNKLVHVDANQKIGLAAYNAMAAGSSLFAQGVPNSERTTERGEPATMRVQVAGKDVFITPTTDNLKVMMGQHPSSSVADSSILTASQNVTHAMSFAVTQATPLFALKNYIGDSLSRLFNFRGYEHELSRPDGSMVSVAEMRMRYIQNVYSLNRLNELYQSVWHGNTSPMLQEFKDSGGLVSFAQQKRTELQVINSFANGRSVLNGKSATARLPAAAQLGLSKLGDIIHKWNANFDYMSGYASYVAMREAGMSSQQAAFVTKENMDFSKVGKVTAQSIRPFYAFANAAMQGAGQVSKTLWGRNGPNYKAWAEVGVLATAAATIFASLRASDDDDESGGKKMDALPDRDLYGTIPVPIGDGNYFKIPVGFDLPLIAATIGVSMHRASLGLISQKEANLDIAQSIVKTYVASGASETPFNKSPYVWMIQTLIPDVLASTANAGMGVNFAGTPLNGVLNRDKFKSDQGAIKTPERYKDVARSLNENLGVDVSPEQLREGVSGVFIGPLKVMLDAAMDVENDKAMKGTDTSAKWGAVASAIGINRFVAKTDDATAVQRAFYKFRDDAADDMKHFESISQKPSELRTEPFDAKMARYTEAGATPQQVQLLTAVHEYDASHRLTSQLNKELYGKLKAGQDVSNELTDAGKKELEYMRTFVLKARAAQ